LSLNWRTPPDDEDRGRKIRRQIRPGAKLAPVTIMQKLEKLWAKHPLPPPTGEVADKAFFDELSGDL